MSRNDDRRPEAPSEAALSKQIAVAAPAFRSASDALARSGELPPLQWESESLFALRRIMDDPNLQAAAPDSLVDALTTVGSLGLTLNPVKQHAALLARYDRKSGAYQASVMVMYRGLLWLARRAGVHDIVADVVYSADRFSLKRTHEGDHFEHEIAFATPRDGEQNKFVGCYVAATMPGSTLPKVEWVPAEDIYRIRAQSDSYIDRRTGEVRQNSGWVRWFDEFAKKAAIKRAQKRWESDKADSPAWTHLQRAVDIDNRTEKVVEDDNVIEGTVIPPEPSLSPEQVAEITEYAGPTLVRKIVAAYDVTKLDEIPASKYAEIKQRVAAAKQMMEQRRRSAAQ